MSEHGFYIKLLWNIVNHCFIKLEFGVFLTSTTYYHIIYLETLKNLKTGCLFVYLKNLQFFKRNSEDYL